MPNQVYGHPASQPQMYMAASQQPPGPPLSPAARPATPQQTQQMQNMMQNSPAQPSPVPSVSSEHGSTQVRVAHSFWFYFCVSVLDLIC